MKPRMMLDLVVFLLLLLTLTSPVGAMGPDFHSGGAHVILRGGGGIFVKLKSKQQYRSSTKSSDSDHGADGGRAGSAGADENSMASSLQGFSQGSGGRRSRACGFYIWDAPSALLHKWCNHLMKDCVYEGRGGKKVRRLRQVGYRLSIEVDGRDCAAHI